MKERTSNPHGSFLGMNNDGFSFHHEEANVRSCIDKFVATHMKHSKNNRRPMERKRRVLLMIVRILALNRAIVVNRNGDSVCHDEVRRNFARHAKVYTDESRPLVACKNRTGNGWSMIDSRGNKYSVPLPDCMKRVHPSQWGPCIRYLTSIISTGLLNEDGWNLETNYSSVTPYDALLRPFPGENMRQNVERDFLNSWITTYGHMMAMTQNTIPGKMIELRLHHKGGIDEWTKTIDYLEKGLSIALGKESKRIKTDLVRELRSLLEDRDPDVHHGGDGRKDVVLVSLDHYKTNNGKHISLFSTPSENNSEWWCRSVYNLGLGGHKMPRVMLCHSSGMLERVASARSGDENNKRDFIDNENPFTMSVTANHAALTMNLSEDGLGVQTWYNSRIADLLMSRVSGKTSGHSHRYLSDIDLFFSSTAGCGIGSTVEKHSSGKMTRILRPASILITPSPHLSASNLCSRSVIDSATTSTDDTFRSYCNFVDIKEMAPVANAFDVRSNSVVHQKNKSIGFRSITVYHMKSVSESEFTSSLTSETAKALNFDFPGIGDVELKEVPRHERYASETYLNELEAMGMKLHKSEHRSQLSSNPATVSVAHPMLLVTHRMYPNSLKRYSKSMNYTVVAMLRHRHNRSAALATLGCLETLCVELLVTWGFSSTFFGCLSCSRDAVSQVMTSCDPSTLSQTFMMFRQRIKMALDVRSDATSNRVKENKQNDDRFSGIEKVMEQSLLRRASQMNREDRNFVKNVLNAIRGFLETTKSHLQKQVMEKDEVIVQNVNTPFLHVACALAQIKGLLRVATTRNDGDRLNMHDRRPLWSLPFSFILNRGRKHYGGDMKVGNEVVQTREFRDAKELGDFINAQTKKEEQQNENGNLNENESPHFTILHGVCFSCKTNENGKEECHVLKFENVPHETLIKDMVLNLNDTLLTLDVDQRNESLQNEKKNERIFFFARYRHDEASNKFVRLKSSS